MHPILSLYYLYRVFAPTNEQTVQHELKKGERIDSEVEHFCHSHIYKCWSQALRSTALKIFDESFLILLKWYALRLF